MDTRQPQSQENDLLVEIRGYATDPKRVGFQILTNYESNYWRALVGSDAWSLYEVLRSFCHYGDDTCYTRIRLLLAILGIKDRNVLTGRTKRVKDKVYEYPGLIEILEEHRLIRAELTGAIGRQHYVFHVNLTPELLTEDQLSQLPEILQQKHEELIKRWEEALQEQTSGAEEDAEDHGISTGGGHGISTGGSVEIPQGDHGISTPEQYPYNNIQKTTVVVEKLRSWKIEEEKAKELATGYPPEVVKQKIEFLEWKLDPKTKTPGRPIEDPAGWLIRAIENDYQPPASFKPKAEREAEARKQREEAEEIARQKAEEERRRQEQRKQEQAERLAVLQEEYGTTEEELRLWPSVLSDLEGQMTAAAFNANLRNSVLLRLKDGEALIAVHNRFVQEMVEHRLAALIQKALARHLDDREDVALEFTTLKPREDSND